MIQLLIGILVASAQQTCDRSNSEWKDFLNQAAFTISQDMSGYEVRNIERELEECEPRVVNAELKTCMQPFMRYLKATKYSRDWSYDMGWEIPTSQYLADLPIELKSLPAPFQDGIPSNWQQYVEQNDNVHVLRYRSRTVRNPPNRSTRRLTFLVEGECRDRWIQFTTPGVKGSGARERLVDTIAVDTCKYVDGVKQPIQPPKIRFVQFWRDWDGRNPQIRDIHDRCYGCHVSGMRQIKPAIGSVPNEDMAALNHMNRVMSRYSQTGYDWGSGVLDPANNGPNLGQTTGCVSCHNDYDENSRLKRGGLKMTTRFTHVHSKMVDYLSMPPQIWGAQNLRPLRNILRQFERNESNEFKDRIVDPDYGNHMGSYGVIVERIRREKDLDPSISYDYADLDAAHRGFQQAQGEAEDQYREFERSSKIEIEKWLKADCQ